MCEEVGIMKSFASGWSGTLGALGLGLALVWPAASARADAITPLAAANAQLNRAIARMDTVHSRHLNQGDLETYLILRGSDSFRNRVFASALDRVRAGCGLELTQLWRDMAASLMFADILSQDDLAAGDADSRSQN
jgi:hypothetical protein